MSDPSPRRAIVLRLLPPLAALLALAFVPRTLAGWSASRYFDGDRETTEALARTVIGDVWSHGPGIGIGGAQLRGEWTLVTDQMSILGLGQLVRDHPDLAATYIAAMEEAAERMMAPPQRLFATQAWGSDALEHLDSARGDAWLGWPALALAMLHRVHPETRMAGLDDRIADALARRLERAPYAIIETYPGQSFPTDVAACMAAVALNARARGIDRSALIARWVAAYRTRWIDPASGLLWQQGSAETGRHRDAPRGSGTAVAAYFLSFVDAGLTRQLVDGLLRNERTLFGFGAVREYAPGTDGHGDGDSGPVLLGVSVAATGFALGAARATHERGLFTDVFRTTQLFGVSATTDERGRYTTIVAEADPHGEQGLRFAAGGAFGNAVMLALLTARGAP